MHDADHSPHPLFASGHHVMMMHMRHVSKHQRYTPSTQSKPNKSNHTHWNTHIKQHTTRTQKEKTLMDKRHDGTTKCPKNRTTQNKSTQTVCQHVEHWRIYQHTTQHNTSHSSDT